MMALRKDCGFSARGGRPAEKEGLEPDQVNLPLNRSGRPEGNKCLS